MAVTNEQVELVIKIGHERIEQGEDFKYLGVNIYSQGEQEKDINCRIEKANRLYYALNKYVR